MKPVRFSLRVLLLTVTLFCVWLARERSVVLERRAFRQSHESGHEFVFATEATWRRSVPAGQSPPLKTVSWLRTLLGDEAVQTLLIDHAVNEADAARSTRLFPEAESSRTQVWTPAPPQIDTPVRREMPLS